MTRDSRTMTWPALTLASTPAAGNNRHRPWIARTHLCLPKMQAIVPKADLRRMAKRWNLDLTTEATTSQGGRLF